jgi:hypothetical protein
MTNNVGMGTSTPQAGLVVTNGNVGIGTWAPAGKFQVNGSTTPSFIITSSGNVGIGTSTPQAGFVVVNGNMGIGTITSNYSLYVNGTAGSAKNVLIGNGLAILTNKNVGIGQNVPTGFEIESNNVGIGTNLDAGALVNVGGNCKTQQGKGVCWGSNSTTGVTCLGYCTTVGWPNCTTCTCC